MADLRWTAFGQQAPFGHRHDSLSMPVILNSPAADFALRVLHPRARAQILQSIESGSTLVLNIERVPRP